MEQLTLFAEEAPAKPSASQDCGRLWTIHAASSCSNISELAMKLIRNGSYGKTSPEYYPQMADALSAHCSQAWPNSGLMGGAAWRVLDAQFYGVAQRRRRVFVVINTRDWRRAAPVLFERESLRRDYPSSREKRQALAGGLAGGAGTPTWCAADSGVNMSVCRDMSPTLTAHDANSACFINAPSTCTIRSGKEGGGKGALAQRDMSATLTTAQQQTLFAGSPDQYSVRRLTPVECERLQGFPDGYTDVPWRGADHAPDSKRYKALGNSMAVPVMRWIGDGIELVNREFKRARFAGIEL